ncbi:hypothetical protein VM98_06505 [Streptomyces rubellomurinus subsp. indigoferus]|nr:hypothetical protein VM98_06505 [Streptomyces rubellomurinus subsp. indigoferus]
MAAAGLLAAGRDSPALRDLAGRLGAGELTPRALAAEGLRGATPTAARTDAERGLLDAVGAGYRLAHLTETRPEEVPGWEAAVRSAAVRPAAGLPADTRLRPAVNDRPANPWS